MLKIKLAPTGRQKESGYRVVVIDEKAKRDGRSFETLGWIDLKGKKPIINVDREKLAEWQKKGAQLTEGVKKKLNL